MIPSRILAEILRAVREGRAKSLYGAVVEVDNVFSNVRDITDIVESAIERHELSDLAGGHTWSVVPPSNPNYSTVTTCALWRFNEDGSDVLGVNNLTVTNCTFDEGKFGNCIVFNGSTSLAQCEFTQPEPIRKWLYVGFWINPNAVTGIRPLLEYGDTLSLYIEDGILKAEVQANAVTYPLNSGLSVSLSTWQYITFQFFEGQIILAVDDLVSWHSVEGDTLTISDDTLTLGSGAYTGAIDDVVIDANVRVRDDWPVYYEISSPRDAIFWTFSEGVGSYVRSTSLVGPILRIYGGSWVDGYRRHAVQFDGINDFAACDNLSSQTMDSFTLEIGIRFDRLSPCPIITQSNGFNLSYDGTGFVANIAGVSNPSVTLGNIALTEGKWYNICVIYDGSRKELWLNGQKVDQVDCAGTATLSDNTFYVATDGSNYAPISVERVRLYKARLRPYYRDIPLFMPGLHGFTPTSEWMVAK